MPSAEWTPILDGEIYCSPACGGRCKLEDFRTATRKARELAASLGLEWRPVVNENLGWHWKTQLGEVWVIPSRAGKYTAGWGAHSSSGETPREALTALSERIREQRDRLSAALDTIEDRWSCPNCGGKRGAHDPSCNILHY